MPKDEQVITHRFDPSFCVGKLMEMKVKYRNMLFFNMVYWGIFFIAIGLLFYEKFLGNVVDDTFWAYFCIVVGLFVFLKAAVFMLQMAKE